jgi:hypothetical protein
MYAIQSDLPPAMIQDRTKCIIPMIVIAVGIQVSYLGLRVSSPESRLTSLSGGADHWSSMRQFSTSDTIRKILFKHPTPMNILAKKKA